MGGNLASVISLARNLFSFFVLLVQLTDGQTESYVAFVMSPVRRMFLSVVLLFPQTDGRTET